MSLKKAVKIEVLVLVEDELTDAEILKWVKMAMRDYCEFDHPVVTLKGKHERIIWTPETDVQA